MSCAAIALGLHLATAHFSGHGLDPIDPGVYVRTECGATAGAFRNSYGRLSTYAGWTWQTEGGLFALTAGAVTGYPAAKVMPLLVPSLRLEVVDGLDARLSFLPKPMKCGTSAGLHLSLEHRF